MTVIRGGGIIVRNPVLQSDMGRAHVFIRQSGKIAEQDAVIDIGGKTIRPVVDTDSGEIRIRWPGPAQCNRLVSCNRHKVLNICRRGRVGRAGGGKDMIIGNGWISLCIRTANPVMVESAGQKAADGLAMAGEQCKIQGRGRSVGRGGSILHLGGSGHIGAPTDDGVACGDPADRDAGDNGRGSSGWFGSCEGIVPGDGEIPRCVRATDTVMVRSGSLKTADSFCMAGGAR